MGRSISAPDVGLIIHVSLVDRVRDFLKPYVTFSKCDMADEAAYLAVTSTGFDLDVGFSVTPTQDVDASPKDYSREALVKLNAARFVLVTSETSETFLPQMIGLDQVGAVDFDKGCYLGQEIVARAQYRGAVKRKLRQVSLDPDTPALASEGAAQAVVVQVAATRPALVVAPV